MPAAGNRTGCATNPPVGLGPFVNFLERRQRELLRITLPRTRVNESVCCLWQRECTILRHSPGEEEKGFARFLKTWCAIWLLRRIARFRKGPLAGWMVVALEVFF